MVLPTVMTDTGRHLLKIHLPTFCTFQCRCFPASILHCFVIKIKVTINMIVIIKPWNMIGEVILEKVPRLLPIHRVHGDQVGGVPPISQELETHPRGSVELACVGLQCQGKPGDIYAYMQICTCCGRNRYSPGQPMLSPLENPRVVVTPKISPLHPSHHSHCVDDLGRAS